MKASPTSLIALIVMFGLCLGSLESSEDRQQPEGSSTKVNTGVRPPKSEPAAQKKDTAPNPVVFYEIPGCPICKAINGILDSENRRHDGRIRIVRKPATDPVNHDEMHTRGVDHHGVVILDSSKKTLWSANAHKMKSSELKKALQSFVIDWRQSAACEIGCAACIYQLPGISGCSTAAVVVDGEPRLLTGARLKVHGTGLCKAAKKATVAGHIDGEKFVATKVELE